MNELLQGMKMDTNFGYTENGGVKHNTTMSALLDMFAMGGAMRSRSDSDVIVMFKKAFAENAEYAMKCLTYLRDIMSGQGERRFFRVCLKYLGQNDYKAAIRNMREWINKGFIRWDDLFVLFDTPAEDEVMHFINKNLIIDLASYKEGKAVSLLGKWLPSENTSSATSRHNARKIMHAIGLTPREYRKMLSALRERIHVVERLMSQNRWDEIDFSKLPSRAGLLYRNTFAENEITKERYAAFMGSKETKVNARVLNPVDIADQIFRKSNPSPVERQVWDKYWENLEDYYGGNEEPGIAVCDVSGSMTGQPMNAAVSMGAYIAERGKGPFHNHFITFSSNPTLVEFVGTDIYDKFRRARNADWGGSTNIEAVFNLLLQTGIRHKVKPENMPKTIYIFSDMEFNACISCGAPSNDRWYNGHYLRSEGEINTVIEAQIKKWKQYGYDAPRVIFWNLDARQENIPAIGDKFSYVSGFSMNMVKSILSGKDGMALMFEKLNEPRYKDIH